MTGGVSREAVTAIGTVPLAQLTLTSPSVAPSGSAARSAETVTDRDWPGLRVPDAGVTDSQAAAGDTS